MIKSFLEIKPNVLFEILLEDYSKLFDIDKEQACKLIENESLFERLTTEWYENLAKGDIESAMKVYDDKYYFVDIFDCYKRYSRKYLMSLLKPTIDKKSVYDIIKNIKSFVDIGCGLGYSTIVLQQMFPKAKGYATNLKQTEQWKFCKVMAKKYDFALVESVNDIPHNVDLVFASEYFEHILDPINHLKNILMIAKPKFLIIANSFNTDSIGHFRNYDYAREYLNEEVTEEKIIKIPESKISRLFNMYLRNSGYSKLETTIWNNRPTIWRQNES